MDSTDLQVLGAMRRWGAEGRRFALVTVARTWGSAPRPPGAWLAVRDDGAVQGSVSGGCIEDDFIRRMQAGEFRKKAVQVVRYGATEDEARRFSLPCGGTLELVVETEPDSGELETIANRIGNGQLVRRQIDTANGTVSIIDGYAGQVVAWDGRTLITPHGPGWRLLLIGAGHVARFLAPMARALDYQVMVCDPREEYTSEWDIPDIRLASGMPDDVVTDFNPNPHSAIVALTHDPKLDDLALLEALKSPAFYVGALGSTGNNARRRQRLLENFDLTEAEVARLHGPVGLAIGSRTPAEIAVSILAEMTAVKNAIQSVALGGGAEVEAHTCRTI